MTGEVRGFKELFQLNEYGYYRKPYNWTWYFEDKPVYNLLIQFAIDGRCVIGVRANEFTRVLGIDIDDHEAGGWRKGHTSGTQVGEMTPSLRELYIRVRSVLSLEPSMKVKSPRGIHLFWFLSSLQHTNTIRDFGREYFGHLGRRVEVLPTKSEAISCCLSFLKWGHQLAALVHGLRWKT